MNLERTSIAILIVVLGVITLGCLDNSVFTSKHKVDVTLREVDIGFRDGSYQQVSNVMSWEVVEKGPLSNTVELRFLTQNYYQESRRIHYVTSIDIISERTVTLDLDDGQYRSVMGY